MRDFDELPWFSYGESFEGHLTVLNDTMSRLEPALNDLVSQAPDVSTLWQEGEELLTTKPWEFPYSRGRREMLYDMVRRWWLGEDHHQPLIMGYMENPYLNTFHHYPGMGWARHLSDEEKSREYRHHIPQRFTLVPEGLIVLPDATPTWEGGYVTRRPECGFPKGPNAGLFFPVPTELISLQWGNIDKLSTIDAHCLRQGSRECWLRYQQLATTWLGLTAEWERLARTWLPALGDDWLTTYDHMAAPVPSVVQVPPDHYVRVALLMGAYFMGASNLARFVETYRDTAFMTLFHSYMFIHSESARKHAVDFTPYQRPRAIFETMETFADVFYPLVGKEVNLTLYFDIMYDQLEHRVSDKDHYRKSERDYWKALDDYNETFLEPIHDRLKTTP